MAQMQTLNLKRSLQPLGQEFILGDIKIKALHTWAYHGKYYLFID
jgi:hypothetical protein